METYSRSRRTGALILFGLLVGGVGLWYWRRRVALPSPVLPEIRGARVLLIGDSLAVGMGPSLEKALASHGSASFLNIARGGTNIKQWADADRPDGAKLEAALAAKPSLVIISLGTNDEASRKPSLKPPFGPTFDVATQRAPAIKKLLARIAGAGAEVVWLGPPTFAANLWPMQRSFRDLLASTVGRNYFNTEPLDIPRGRDNLHPSSAGHKKWVDAIMYWLKSAGAVV